MVSAFGEGWYTNQGHSEVTSRVTGEATWIETELLAREYVRYKVPYCDVNLRSYYMWSTQSNPYRDN